MICDICGREKDENTVICTNCGPQCECDGPCSSHAKEKKREKRVIENIKDKFKKGNSKN